MQTTLSTLPIAPCGIDCRLCSAYQREKNHCPGCRVDDPFKSTYCINCRIKNCEKLAAGKLDFCFGCEAYPCARIKHLEKRYTSRYCTSVLENLRIIQTGGLAAFIEGEDQKWACSQCGALLCMHKTKCLACGYPWR
jgi:hypothetical protein